MFSTISPSRLRKAPPHGDFESTSGVCPNNRHDNRKSDRDPPDLEGSTPLLIEENGDAMGKKQKSNIPSPIEDKIELYGYAVHGGFTALTWAGVVCSLGLLRLVFHWRPAWHLYCTHRPCSLESATKILLVDQFKQKFVEEIKIIAATDINIPAMHSLLNDAPWINGGDKIPPTKLQLLRPKSHGEFWPLDKLVYFENKKVRYLWDPDLGTFAPLPGLDHLVPCSYFHHVAATGGLLPEDQIIRRLIYGENSILVEVEPIFHILFKEVLEPFYIFQVFSVLIWYLDNYVYYATCIIVMSALSLTLGVIQIRKNQKALRNTVHLTDIVTILRKSNETEQVPSEDLVPGDVIVLPRRGGCVMQCDAVLVSGNCIVNESMLTGESVPVTKTPLTYQPDQNYNLQEHAKHTLFCGTKVIQTRYYGNELVKAVVIRTGFATAKGELVRSIMFPKPVDFQFNRHVHKFILCLAALASVGFLYTVVLKALRGESPGSIALRALDLITIVIPPALPAAMTIGIVFAQQRLKKSQIYCISPRSINISGCINCVAFDKTGTLTEEGLDLWGVVPCSESRFKEAVQDVTKLPESGDLMIGLATCHSLTLIDGHLSGDPLDLKMFEATHWIFEECNVEDTLKFDMVTPTIVRPPITSTPAPLTESQVLGLEPPPLEVGIVRQFPFSSSLQRMSVIVRVLGAPHFMAFTKGAPETIISLCQPHTIPEDFGAVLRRYTERGLRVLALGCRPLPRLSYARVQRAARPDVETELTFLGLLVMENRLKPETAPVLASLHNAAIRTVMVTGDNLLTALSVARDCSMIERHHQVIILESSNSEPDVLSWHYSNTLPTSSVIFTQLQPASGDSLSIILDKQDKIHLALTGKTFALLQSKYPDLLKKVAVRGTVFSRMAPQQKQHLVECLQELGYYVAMCGDGANDCGALKAAHAGISLSEAEASVASPFTSKSPNISCVITLIREGRAALVTSFGVLKYMACYSLTQFISVIILYTLHSNLSDMQFLYIDLFLITLFATLFGRTQAYPSLARRPPPSSLVEPTPLVSLLSQVSLVLLWQLGAVWILWRQPWYIPHPPEEEEEESTHDNLAVFSISVFQYITLVVVFSQGAPYRRPLYTNWSLTVSLIVMTLFSAYLVLIPDPWLTWLFQLAVEGSTLQFRAFMLLLASAQFILALAVEYFLVGYLLFRKWQRPPAPFALLEAETRGAPTWLPASAVSS